jgi:hypothetical protein
MGLGNAEGRDYFPPEETIFSHDPEV